MNQQYIIFQDKNIKVPLLAKNGIWKFKLSDINWRLSDSLERYYAYLIFCGQNYGELSRSLRLMDRHITTIEIDKFVQYFRSKHPAENECFSLSDIPIYATDIAPLKFPTPFGYDIDLTISQESELLSKIQKQEGNVVGALEHWFNWYIRHYGLSPKLKRDIPIQGWEIARMFCLQHGININKLPNTSSLDSTSRKQGVGWSFKVKVIICVLFYIALAIWLIADNDKITDSFNFQTLLMTIGWLMLGIPLAIILIKQNDTIKRKGY